MKNPQLEDQLILEKSKRRFLRTKLERIEEDRHRDDEKNKSLTYVLLVNPFKLRIHYSLDKLKKQEEFSLDILTSEGKFVKRFDDSNPNYAPILKEIYQDIERKIYSEQEKESRKKETNSKLLKKLRRIL